MHNSDNYFSYLYDCHYKNFKEQLTLLGRQLQQTASLLMGYPALFPPALLQGDGYSPFALWCFLCLHL